MALNQLEQRYGGTAKDKEVGEFWPPSLPDNDFGVADQKDMTEFDRNVPDQNRGDEGAVEVNEDEFMDCN